jgi:hypothetical protein
MAHRCFLVLKGRNVECFHHDASRTIGFKLFCHQLPHLTPLLGGQEFLLPSAVQKCPRFASQSINDVAVVDAVSSALGAVTGPAHSREFQHLLFADIAEQAVMIQMHR